MADTMNARKGTSIIEVMVAIVICLIVIMGGFSLFVRGRSQIDSQGSSQVAVQLAAQKLEELKAGSYGDIKEGGNTEQIAMEQSSYDRTVDAEDLGKYKKVTVHVNWQSTHQRHDVSLATIIAPK